MIAFGGMIWVVGAFNGPKKDPQMDEVAFVLLIVGLCAAMWPLVRFCIYIDRRGR